MTKANNNLEDALLVRARNRFRRTRISNIDVPPFIENGDYHLEKYILERKGFKEQLFYTTNSSKNLIEYGLWIIKPDGCPLETFESKNPHYAPTLKEMYDIVKKRVDSYNEKRKSKELKESEKRQKRFNRRLL
jgi:hypothetical protein